MTVIIKSMETPEEIEGKSLVHWQTWREAYDDLLPAEFQETMTLERCRFFSKKYPENTLIAMDGMKVVGFISYGNFRDKTMQAGEIIALYVLKDYYGKGIAQKLVKAALTALDSFSEIFLWVLKDNKRAIAFYQKMGFTFDGQEKMLELGKPIKERRMVFYSNTLRKSLQTTSASPCRTQVQPAASFLVCTLIFIEYK